MPLVSCTNCRGEVSLPDDWLAPDFTCPHCAAVVTITAPESASLDFDSGPRRRRDRETRRQPKPAGLTPRSLFVAILAGVFLAGLLLLIFIRAYVRWNGL